MYTDGLQANDLHQQQEGEDEKVFLGSTMETSAGQENKCSTSDFKM